MNVFWEPNGFLIALTYGPDSGWVKNVLASGGCQLETRGVLLHHLCMPTVIHDPTRRQQFPVLVRVILGLISANDFLRLFNFRCEQSRVLNFEPGGWFTPMETLSDAITPARQTPVSRSTP